MCCGWGGVGGGGGEGVQKKKLGMRRAYHLV